MRPLALPRRKSPRHFVLVTDSGDRLSLESYRAMQQAVLLIASHGSECPECRLMVEGLIQRRAEIESWDTQIALSRSTPGAFRLNIDQAYDPSGTVTASLAPGADIAVACIDFRGRLMDGWSVTHPGEVDWREVAKTVRWAAIQEPECGTCAIAPGWDE